MEMIFYMSDGHCTLSSGSVSCANASYIPLSRGPIESNVIVTGQSLENSVRI
ncbi:conserved hypothetical protein, partial [Trichinella spiralis]|uniref:hypothetical protein n=1 Tax=Trichinella spiralis TaxID=6334 RepID=UPI0001EFEDE0